MIDIPVMLDQTHDRDLQSWVASARGHCDFPVQNLPFGLFSPKGSGARAGIAIGDLILDLPSAAQSGLFDGGAKRAAEIITGSTTLNAFLAMGRTFRNALRHRVSELLTQENWRARVELNLHRAADCTMHVPAQIGNYTDFYVGIHHATKIGTLFRPDNPLLPNYKHIPIAYHGRASSIRSSGTPVIRPGGQTKALDADTPTFGPSARLDYELELGIWIGPGNELGSPIPVTEAAAHVAGYCLLNDWSARDIQAWEYQPLGPFLAKNFSTTISPWIVTPEALAPFRVALPQRPDGDPRPLPYLMDDADQRSGGLAVELEVLLLTQKQRCSDLMPHRLGLSDTRFMYWSVAQMVAHHTSNGCNLQPGDLLGTGTISGADLNSCGSILEATDGGKTPILLPSGEERRFLEDGDEVIFRAQAHREGYISIGFGECRAMVVPMRQAPST